MLWTTLLAHGVLGPYDEVILPIIGIAFIALLLVTWFKSRGLEPLDEDAPDSLPKSDAPPTAQTTPDSDHFRLD